MTIGSVHTAGSRREGSPVIGDDCYIGAGAKIIGGIRIGNGCRIGANAVVYEDMPDHSVALCAPTRIVVRDAPMDNRFYAVEPDGTRLCWQDGALRRAEPTAPGRGESAT